MLLNSSLLCIPIKAQLKLSSLGSEKVGRDKASNYGGGIVGRNAIRTNTAENVFLRNKMYSKEDVSIEQDDLQDMELVLGQGLKKRKRTLNEWLSSKKKRR